MVAVWAIDPVDNVTPFHLLTTGALVRAAVIIRVIEGPLTLFTPAPLFKEPWHSDNWNVVVAIVEKVNNSVGLFHWGTSESNCAKGSGIPEFDLVVWKHSLELAHLLQPAETLVPFQTSFSHQSLGGTFLETSPPTLITFPSVLVHCLGIRGLVLAEVCLGGDNGTREAKIVCAWNGDERASMPRLGLNPFGDSTQLALLGIVATMGRDDPSEQYTHVGVKFQIVI